MTTRIRTSHPHLFLFHKIHEEATEGHKEFTVSYNLVVFVPT
jgi:hypothetical protein